VKEGSSGGAACLAGSTDRVLFSFQAAVHFVRFYIYFIFVSVIFLAKVKIHYFYTSNGNQEIELVPKEKLLRVYQTK